MADAGGPSRPRVGLAAFSGGPLGIGWAPWAIGAAALLAGLFLFFRQQRGRAGPQTQAGSMPLTSQPSLSITPPSGQQLGSVGQGLNPIDQLVWQFGAPPGCPPGNSVPSRSCPNAPLVWQATPTGAANFAASQGGAWPGGVFPGIPDVKTQNALGQFGWQWALSSGQQSSGQPGSLSAQQMQSVA